MSQKIQIVLSYLGAYEEKISPEMVWKLLGMSRQGEKWNHFMVDLGRHHLLSKSWNYTMLDLIKKFFKNVTYIQLFKQKW